MIPAWFFDQNLSRVRTMCEKLGNKIPEHVHGVGHTHKGCDVCPPKGTLDIDWIPLLQDHWMVISADKALWFRNEDERAALEAAGNHTMIFGFQDHWTFRRRAGLILASMDRFVADIEDAGGQHVVYITATQWDRVKDGRHL